MVNVRPSGNIKKTDFLNLSEAQEPEYRKRMKTGIHSVKDGWSPKIVDPEFYLEEPGGYGSYCICEMCSAFPLYICRIPSLKKEHCLYWYRRRKYLQDKELAKTAEGGILVR